MSLEEKIERLIRRIAEPEVQAQEQPKKKNIETFLEFKKLIN